MATLVDVRSDDEYADDDNSDDARPGNAVWPPMKDSFVHTARL